MVLPNRDRQIVSLADYFGQLSSSHVQTLLFSDNKSETPCRRTLRRLVDQDFLSRIERRLVGGDKGGSGTYIYTLGKEGWKLCEREGRYRSDRAINFHTLTIVDVYVRLRESEKAGRLKLNGFTPEPEAWETISGIELKPDLLVELMRPDTGRTLTAWLEVDLSTQRQARLNEKMDRYARAFQVANREEFPLVIFICHDEDRRQEIEWVIKRRDETEPDLFRVTTVENFPDKLS